MQLQDLLTTEDITTVQEVAADTILERDPMGLNRSQFDQYLRAKAAVVYAETLNEGRDEAMAQARMTLYHLDAEWRNAARRLAHQV